MKACPPRKVAQNHTITVFPVIPNPGFTGVKDLFPERDQNRFFHNCAEFGTICR